MLQAKVEGHAIRKESRLQVKYSSRGGKSMRKGKDRHCRLKLSAQDGRTHSLIQLSQDVERHEARFKAASHVVRKLLSRLYKTIGDISTIVAETTVVNAKIMVLAAPPALPSP